MPRLSSTGTQCCGMVSLSRFCTSHTKTACTTEITKFKDSTLLNLSQPYGETDEFELDSLMEVVDKGLPGRVLQAVLNEDQYYLKDRYWPKKLRKHGFRLIRRFDNPTGYVCFLYLRVPTEVRMPIKGY